MKMNVFELGKMTEAERAKMMRRAEMDIDSVLSKIQPIIDQVKSRGDVALREYAKQFEGADLKTVKVTQAEIKAAYQEVSPELTEAIRRSAQRIRNYHEAQMPDMLWWVELEAGVFAGEKTTPIPSVGLYVPRGKGCFPSVMMMLAIPAVVAKVPRVVVMTPPTKEGGVDAVSLVAADICGVNEIYKSGGAQGIAALKFGTETVPQVVKVIGPGNSYTSAAQRYLFGTNIGLPAGPSESLILADEHADSLNVALDFLNEAEHGPDSSAVLVTHSTELAEKVQKHIPELVADLPEERRRYIETVLNGYGGIVITNTLQESLAFANDYAPEHMELLVKDPDEALKSMVHAGEVLLGETTPIAIANFNLGVNAILPTGRAAFCHSATTVRSFLKTTSLGKLTKEGFAKLKEDAQILAEYEGFPSHAAALKKRRI